MSKICIFLSLFSFTFSFGQEEDSITSISEVKIDAYKKPTKLISSTKSVSVVSQNLMSQNLPERMLEAINQTSGTRMEERSPGSYRISVRGSTLRSPFGVRNVKVYLDDFILSDASEKQLINSHLSRQKKTYIKALADEILNKGLDLESLHNLEEDEIRNKLINVKGIGSWTVNVYLMMCLKKEDIFPLGDIALKNTMKELTGLQTEEEMLKLAD